MKTVELIKKDLQNKKDFWGRPMIDTVVILKKDDKGYYIEYAFQDGAPHDNRCLSWYDSYQPEAYRMNGWFKKQDGTDLPDEETQKRLDMIREEIEKKIGKVFRLTSLSCGFEEDEKNQLAKSKESWEEHHPDEPFVPEDHVCRPGCPAKACQWVRDRVFPWTYENPVKCACWLLKDGQTMEDYINNYQISILATELAKLM